MNHRITLSCTSQNFVCTFLLCLGIFFNLIYCKSQDMNQPPFRYVLENGLTILVKKVENGLPVAIQLWIKAGSKDEPLEHKGDAHLLEHLLFKGTQRMSERDIWLIEKKFSGYVNAATHYDYTQMELNFPKEYWKIGIPILADCLANCTLRQEVLNSELKVVVEEFKEGKDSTVRALFDTTMAHLFPFYHPYHHPIIGYKHDLYKADSQRVRNFYQKYYAPNNVVLVVVGNVDEQEVVQLAQEHFGALKAKPIARAPIPTVSSSIQAKSINLYRDIEQPILQLAFKIPGITQRARFIDDIFHIMLTVGESSRLYKKLVDELKLVSSISSANYNLMESDVLTITAELRSLENADLVIDCVTRELEKIIHEGPSAEEINRFKSVALKSYRQLCENNREHAQAIGYFNVLFNDETKIYDYVKFDLIPADISEQVKQFVKSYLRPSSSLKVLVQPFLNKDDEDSWEEMQKLSDEEDAKILNAMYRKLPLETGKYVYELEFNQERIESIEFPAEEFTLKNGLKVIYHNRSDSDLIHFGIYLKTLESQEAHDQRDSLRCLNKFLKRCGTKNYTAAEISERLTHLCFDGRRGIGSIVGNTPAENFEEVLRLLIEKISNPVFDESKLAQIIDEMEAEDRNLSNEPSYKLDQNFNAAVYGKDHPLGTTKLVDVQLLRKLTIDKLNALYRQFVTPQEGVMVLIGNVPIPDGCSLQEQLEELFQDWTGSSRDKLTPIYYPQVTKPTAQTVNAISLRDQISLAYGTLSLDAKHPDCCALELYSLHLRNRLFSIRERTGAFYTINGDMLDDVSKRHAGKAIITTMVSADRLCEVKNILQEFIVSDIDAFSQADLEEAKATMQESYKLLAKTPQGAFSALSYVAQENESLDFFTKRLGAYENVKLEDVKRAVREIFKPEHMITVQVGRIADEHITCGIPSQTGALLKESEMVVA